MWNVAVLAMRLVFFNGEKEMFSLVEADDLESLIQLGASVISQSPEEVTVIGVTVVANSVNA